MPRRNFCLYALVFIGLSILGEIHAGATTLRRLSFDALIQGSDYVIYGRVVGSRAQWDPATDAIWTRTEILVLAGPKGEAGPTITVTEPGGVVNGRGELYPGIPTFRMDQEVVLFLYRAPGNRVRVTGMLQGLYLVEVDRRTGERVARAAFPKPEVVFEAGSGYAQAENRPEAGTESLSRFLYAIRQRAAAR